MLDSNLAHVIIVGNEKGGCGKTTTSTHILVYLMKLGFTVGSVDIDSRQRSLTRYLDNRRQTSMNQEIPLELPRHVIVSRSPFNVTEDAEADERRRFSEAMDMLRRETDFIIVDCPGNDVYLSRLAHSYADTVITPINDSFIDMDVLAVVDGDTYEVIRPSIYSEMLWEQKLERAKRDSGSIDWVVMRNRLSMLDAKNKRKMADVIQVLSKRIGFRVASGFGERVIFRELFLQGLTVMDVMDGNLDVNVSMSHVAARQEVRKLIAEINIPAVNKRLENPELCKPAASSLERNKVSFEAREKAAREAEQAARKIAAARPAPSDAISSKSPSASSTIDSLSSSIVTRSPATA